MAQDPRVKELLAKMTQLQQQYAKFKVQAAALAEKLPPDSPERANVQLLAEQFNGAITLAGAELEKLGVSKSQINKALQDGNPKPSKIAFFLVVLAILTLAGIGVFFFISSL